MNQINQSSNSVAKFTPSTGGTPTASAPTVSSNQPSKVSLSTGTYAFEGDDLTDNSAPGDMMSGQAPGLGESGGVAHFKAKVLPVISH